MPIKQDKKFIDAILGIRGYSICMMEELESLTYAFLVTDIGYIREVENESASENDP